MKDVTDIVYLAFVILSALFSSCLLPYIKSRLSREKYDALSSAVKTAVFAAEKMYKGTKRGEEKKDFVLSYLGEHGYTVDTELCSRELDVMIEAAIYEMEK